MDTHSNQIDLSGEGTIQRARLPVHRSPLGRAINSLIVCPLCDTISWAFQIVCSLFPDRNKTIRSMLRQALLSQ
jgi:hypothetical protein